MKYRKLRKELILQGVIVYDISKKEIILSNTHVICLFTEVYKNDVNKVRAAITLAESNPEDFAETYKKVVEEYEYEKQIEALNSDNNGTENTENAESAESTENTGAEDVDDLLKDFDEGANV